MIKAVDHTHNKSHDKDVGVNLHILTCKIQGPKAISITRACKCSDGMAEAKIIKWSLESG